MDNIVPVDYQEIMELEDGEKNLKKYYLLHYLDSKVLLRKVYTTYSVLNKNKE